MTAAEIPEPFSRHPDTPGGRRLVVAAVAAVLCLGLPACGEDEEPLRVLPITADVTIAAPIMGDPLVFLAKVNVAPGFIDPDTVRLAVMLRTALTTYSIDAINLEITFDPDLIQVLGPDLTMTPFGACNGPSPCDPSTCLANTADANASGDLIIGISRDADPACAYSANTAGQSDPDIPMAGDAIPILTFDVRAATVGSSEIHFFTSPGVDGDCEVLEWGPADVIELPFTFNDGGALLTASR